MPYALLSRTPGGKTHPAIVVSDLTEETRCRLQGIYEGIAAPALSRRHQHRTVGFVSAEQCPHLMR